jgi:hypothetical protein
VTASAAVTVCAGKGGALRVATRCRRGERRLRLVAEPATPGPKGDAGPQGTAGPQGATGAQGATGTNGADGTKGTDGAPGTPGTPGPSYNAGAGLDLFGTTFALEVPLALVRNSFTATSPGPSLIDVTNTAHESAFGPVRPAAIEGTATSTAHGNTASDAVTGVLGVVEPTSPGGFSAGVRGVNSGTGGVGIGVAGLHKQSGWGVYGQAPTGYGVVGEIANAGGGGAAMRAAFTGAGPGTALELDGGIRVAGANPPVFQADLSTSCGGNNAYSVLNNPLINGDPNAMLIVTHTDTSTGGVQFAGMPLGVVYNTAANPIAGCTTDRWLVFTELNSTMPDIIVNVLAIST